MWWLLLACPAPSETGDSDCPPIVWHADIDADGFGSPADTTEACTRPAGHVSNGDDCDDLDAAMHPGAPETCDGADQDCDGTPDDGLSSFADTDGDGFGDAAAVVNDCMAGIEDATDCDDTRSDVHLGADEICDGVDQDCDGATDEDPVDMPWWYLDSDGDGWGTSAGASQACEAPSNTVSASGDCDDADPAISPGATEVCENGIDEDCDGPDDCRISGTWDGGRAAARILGETEPEGMAWAGGVGEIDGSPGLFVASNDHVWVFYEAPVGDVYVTAADATFAVPSGGLWERVVGSGTDLGTDGIEDLLLYDSWNDVLYAVSADSSGGVESVAGASLVNASSSSFPFRFDTAPQDMGGDSYADVWVSTPGATTSVASAGAAYLMSGPLSGTLSLDAAEATVVSNVESKFGEAVATVDLDGDGLPELAVGAPTYTEGGAEGAVFLFEGLSDGVLDAADADAIVVGGGIYDGLGTDLYAADDLDGDGVADLLVGGYMHSCWHLLPGPVASADASTAASAHYWAGSGARVSTADLDGDGDGDLALTAYAQSTYLYYGPVPSGTIYEGDASDATLGAEFDNPLDATSPGDLNADGYDDLLVVDSADSARGATYLFLGSGL